MYLVKRVMVPETRWHITFLSEAAEWAGASMPCFPALPLDLLSPTETAVRFTEGNTAAVVSEAKSPIQSRALNSVCLSPSLSFFPAMRDLGLPNQGSKPCVLHWEHRVLSTGLPGKSPSLFLRLFLHTQAPRAAGISRKCFYWPESVGQGGARCWLLVTARAAPACRHCVPWL